MTKRFSLNLIIALTILAFTFQSFQIQGQCPEITSINISPAGPFCKGSTFTLTATGNDMSSNHPLVWGIDNDTLNNPGNSLGWFICQSSVNTPPCGQGPSILYGWINPPPGPDKCDEFLVIWTGAGFNSNSLTVNANGTMGPPWVMGNGAIYTGCGVQPIGPNTVVPKNAILIIQASAIGTEIIDLSSLCSLGLPIYVIASSNTDCSGGWFTNNYTGTPPYTVSTPCGSANFSYSTPGGCPPGTGWSNVGGLATYGNIVPPVSVPDYIPIPSTITPAICSIPDNLFDQFCSPPSSKLWVLAASTEPGPAGCPPTNWLGYIEIQINCPQVQASYNQPLCEGGTLQLTATDNFVTYQWAGPNGFTSNVQNPTKSNMKISDGGLYTVTITDDGGCKAIGFVNVNVTPNFTATINPSNPEICVGGTTQLTAQLNPGGTYTYLWESPSGNNGFSSVYIANEPGAYQVTMTSSTGCMVVKSVQVKQNPLPKVSINPPIASICSGNSIQLTAEGNGGTGNLSYSWTTPTGIKSGAQITANIPGNYSASVIDSKGCMHDTSIVITNAPQPKATTNKDTAFICGGGQVIVHDTVAGGTPGYQFQWVGVTGTPDSLKFTATGQGTLLFIVTDTLGCKDTAITYLLPTSTLSIGFNPGTVEFCKGNSQSVTVNVGGSNGTVKYQWSTPNGGGGNQNTILADTAGMYQVTVTDAGNCPVIGSFTATELQLPILTFNAVNGLCPGDSTLISVTGSGGTGGLNYTWKTPSGIETGASISTKGPGSYSVTVSDSKQCASSSSLMIEAYSNPLITLNTSQPSFCIGGSIALYGVASGGLGPYLYYWDGAGGTVFDSLITVSVPGMMILEVLDDHGCKDTAQVIVSETSGLSVQINPQQAVICPGGSVELNAMISGGGTGNIIFTWSTPSGPLSSNPIIANQTGKYYVTLTDASGCTGSDTIQVTQSNNLPIQIKPINPVMCNGDPVTLSVDISGGQMPYTYKWQEPGGNIGGGATWPAAKGGIYGITVTDNNGCKGTDTAFVHQPFDVGILILPQIITVCPGGSTTITAIATGGYGTYSYAWITPNGSLSGNPIQATASGAYFLTVSDGVNCSATMNINVLPSPGLSVDINPDTVKICAGSSATLSTTVLPGTSILWNTPQGPFNTASITVNQTGPIELIVSDSSGCQGKDTAFAIQSPNLSVDITPNPLKICSGSIGQLLVAGGNSGSIYQWSIPGGGTASTNPLNVTVPGNYTVTVTDQGCTGSTSADVVLAQSAQLEIQASDPAICNGSIVTLTAMALNGVPDMYNWITPLGIKSGSSINVTLPGNYTCIASGSSICADTINYEMLGSYIQAELDVIDAGCLQSSPGEILLANLQTDQQILNYSINQSPPTKLPGIGESLGLFPKGMYQVVLIDTNGCTFEKVVTIVGLDGPSIELGPDVHINLGGTATLIPVTSGNIISYQWIPGQFLNCDTCSQVLITPPSTQQIWCTVVDANDCPATDSILVTVDEKIATFVPNVISNDANGINDRLILYTNPEFVQEIEELRVFNRWGDLVFLQEHFPPNDANYGWEGKVDGKYVNPDVYVYYFKVKLVSGKILLIKGDVTTCR